MVYPVFLNLGGRRCLVIGGGSVAARKVDGLLEAGASVRLVAPRVVARIRDLAEAGRIEWLERPFEELDVEGCQLVFAAADRVEVNRAAAETAEAHGLFCNLADQPELGSFTLPAVLRRGKLTVAVSTAGASPFLAGRIRDDLAENYGPIWSDYVDLLARCRRAVLRRNRPAGENRPVFKALVEADLLGPLAEGDRAELLRRLTRATGLTAEELGEDPLD